MFSFKKFVGMLKIFKVTLFPIAIIYDFVTTIRNLLYDIQWFQSFQFNVPTIVVGNLTVGGTGKTPMTEFLIKKLIQKEEKVAMLSRGYGRKTKGFVQAGPNSTAQQIGDEPYQVFRKFKHEVPVFVGEKRVKAIQQILSGHESFDSIILDDAYQHRKLRADCYVLLTDYGNPFYRDWLLPTGLLRESRKGAKRANVIVVTKCPQKLKNQEKFRVRNDIEAYSQTPVFFSRIKYGQPLAMSSNGPRFDGKKEFVLVTGLANPKPLVEFVSNTFKLIHHFGYSDHFDYRQSDIDDIVNYCKNRNAQMITSEKDMVKMIVPELNWRNFGCRYYVPIEVEIDNEEDFLQLVYNRK